MTTHLSQSAFDGLHQLSAAALMTSSATSQPDQPYRGIKLSDLLNAEPAQPSHSPSTYPSSTYPSSTSSSPSTSPKSLGNGHNPNTTSINPNQPYPPLSGASPSNFPFPTSSSSSPSPSPPCVLLPVNVNVNVNDNTRHEVPKSKRKDKSAKLTSQKLGIPPTPSAFTSLTGFSGAPISPTPLLWAFPPNFIHSQLPTYFPHQTVPFPAMVDPAFQEQMHLVGQGQFDSQFQTYIQSPQLSTTSSHPKPKLIPIRRKLGVDERTEIVDERLERAKKLGGNVEDLDQIKDILKKNRPRGALDLAGRRLIHNVSEKKRRNTIKSGFQTLREFVSLTNPEKHSKNEILKRAIQQIETLKTRKETLFQDVQNLKTEIEKLKCQRKI